MLSIEKLPEIPKNVVARYARDKGISKKTSARRFQELVKYLLVCATYPGQNAPSRAMDDLWHTFVLFTKDYQNFCASHFGLFIHHNPTKTSETKLYRQTRARAEEMFGSLDPELWPYDFKLAGDCKSSCNGDNYCNDQGEA